VSMTETDSGFEQVSDEPQTSLEEGASQGGAESKPQRWLRGFLAFLRKPWWNVVFWMLLFCLLLLVTIVLAPHVSNLVTGGFTRAGIEKWGTSSFATAAGAVSAAAIAGSAVVATLKQNRRAEANKTWWETFEWAAERAIPSKKENKDQALPYGASLAILSPLLDDDLGGRRASKSEQKSWALRKQACESLIGVLRETYEKAKPESEAEAIADPAGIPASSTEEGAPLSESQTEGLAPASKKDTLKQAGDQVEPSPLRRPVLTDNDVTSVKNFVEAHPESQQSKRLLATHFEMLIGNSLATFLRNDPKQFTGEPVRILTDHRHIQLRLGGLNPRPKGLPDALVVRGEKMLWVEAKSLAGASPDRVRQIISSERISAKRLWEANRIPTLLIHDASVGRDEFVNEDHFRVVPTGRWTNTDWRRITKEVHLLLR
jgi:hypothetical protein